MSSKNELKNSSKDPKFKFDIGADCDDEKDSKKKHSIDPGVQKPNKRKKEENKSQKDDYKFWF